MRPSVSRDPVDAHAAPVLEIRGLVHRFGPLTALAGVDLTVRSGEIVGLVGPNGAGKTTLIDIVAGKIRPSGGEVRFFGQRITGKPAHRVARLGIARTSQIVQPFVGMTALDVVTVGALFGRAGGTRRIAAARRNAEAALVRLGLGSQRDKAADSLNIVDRKRIELARALAMNPMLLLLDEVMAGLVPSEVQSLVGQVRQVRDGGVAIIIVEHVMHAITRLCDRVAVLRQGTVLAQGPPAIVLRDPRVIETYLGRRFRPPEPTGMTALQSD
jgi:branched-chain amino acid transport system ATP-binding protein